MISFLEKLASDIYQKYEHELSDICIVMPARRSKKYFSHYLNKIAKKTILMPELFSIDEFIEQVSDLKLIDSTELLLILYQHHTNEFPEDGNDFKRFVGWASIFLKDINEIDMQLADAKAVFTSLTDIKSLSMYDIPENQRSQMQKNYLRFFEQLYHNYLYLQHQLLEKKMGYQGLMFREAYRSISEKPEQLTWSKILFCGFNALTNSEIEIIKKLLSEKKADTYWDADKTFFDDNIRDASLFMRQAKKQFNLKENFPFIENNFAEIPKNIHIIGTPNNISQVKFAGEIFEKHKSQHPDSTNTIAIVPADENLLPSLLNTITPSDANITMGLPLNQTLIGKFYHLVLNMHLNRYRLIKQNRRSSNAFYHKDIFAILSHPIIQKMADSINNNSLKNALSHFKKLNITYANFSLIRKLEGLNDEFLKQIENIFTLEQNPQLLIEHFGVFNITLKNILENKSNNNILDYFNETSIQHFQEIFDFIKLLLPKYNITEGIDFLANLYASKVSEYNTSFIGDAIHGPQVMGLLETRLLDFETVVMLSVNEGTLPSGKSSNSLLPFDLRRHFGLHSHIQKDAIFSYHFFRLLQRAKTIYLIYNSDLKDGKSEKSRFIRQLTHDIVPQCKNIQIHENILNISPLLFQRKNITIHKTDFVNEQMKTLSQISPTALSNYIKCPLRFYFSQIARINETDEITENADDAMLGSVVHEVLQKIYEQFPKKQKIEIQQFSNILKTDFDPLIVDAFENIRNKKISKENLQFGKNRLAFEVVKNYINEFLSKEENLICNNELIPLGFELKCRTNLQLDPNTSKCIELYGVIDRIDILNGDLRILDYKSGSVKQKELEFSDVKHLFIDPNLSKSLQLMCYSLLFYEQTEDLKSKIERNGFIPAIIPFKSHENTIDLLYNKENILSISTILEFKEELRHFLNNILSDNLVFSPTSEEKNCEYCPYKTICQKD